MIHYNPSKHHNTIVCELKRCFNDMKEVRRPLSPSPKDGCQFIIADDHTYIIDNDTYHQLWFEATCQWKDETKKSLHEKFGEHTDVYVEYLYYTKLLDMPKSQHILPYIDKKNGHSTFHEIIKGSRGRTSCMHPEHCPYWLKGKK